MAQRKRIPRKRDGPKNNQTGGIETNAPKEQAGTIPPAIEKEAEQDLGDALKEQTSPSLAHEGQASASPAALREQAPAGLADAIDKEAEQDLGDALKEQTPSLASRKTRKKNIKATTAPNALRAPKLAPAHRRLELRFNPNDIWNKPITKNEIRIEEQQEKAKKLLSNEFAKETGLFMMGQFIRIKRAAEQISRNNWQFDYDDGNLLKDSLNKSIEILEKIHLIFQRDIQKQILKTLEKEGLLTFLPYPFNPKNKHYQLLNGPEELGPENKPAPLAQDTMNKLNLLNADQNRELREAKPKAKPKAIATAKPKIDDPQEQLARTPAAPEDPQRNRTIDPLTAPSEQGTSNQTEADAHLETAANAPLEQEANAPLEQEATQQIQQLNKLAGALTIQTPDFIEDRFKTLEKRLIEKGLSPEAINILKETIQEENITLEKENKLNEPTDIDYIWNTCKSYKESKNSCYRFAFRLTKNDKTKHLFDNPKLFEKIIEETNPQEYIFQMELGPKTNKLHYQGYLKLRTKDRIQKLTRDLNRKAPGIEVSHAFDEKALIAYCSKLETRKDGPWSFPT